MHTRDSIQEFLVNALADILGMDPSKVNVNEPLENFSLDSIAAMDLVGTLEEHLQRPLPPTIIFDYPNIAGLVDHLALKI